MRVQPASWTLGLAAVLVAACTDGAVTSSVRPPDAAQFTRSGSPDAAVALSLATALADPAARRILRDALRASPYTEHKLVLQDFVQTPPGEELLRIAAGRAGVSRDELLRQMALLPRLDLYVPWVAHRKSWRGTPDVLVSVALDPDRSRLRAFSPAGVEQVLRPSRQSPPAVLILMHPEEPKARRWNAQPNTPGDVIQEPNDGELSGVIAIRRNGRIERVDLADLQGRGGAQALEECDPQAIDCGGGGGGGGGTGTPTKMHVLEVLGVIDNGNEWEGNEFEFGTQARHSNGVEFDRGSLYLYGTPADFYGIINQPLINRVIFGTDYVNVNIVEIDGSPNPDDNFDPDPIITGSSNGAQFGAGDWRCGYTNVYGTHACGPYIWKEINFTVIW